MKKQTIDIAKTVLLTPAGLSETQVEAVLGNILSKSIDYADIYLQSSYHETWVLEDGIVKDGSFNIDRGVGVRAISGEKTGFAFSDDIILPALEDAAKAARSISHQGGAHPVLAWKNHIPQSLYAHVSPMDSLNEIEKLALLQQADKLARASDPRIKEVTASLSAVYDVVMVITSEGTLAADVRPMVRMNVSVIAEQNGRRERGSSGGGGRVNYQWFVEHNKVQDYVKEAVHQACVNLEAVAAPAGPMPVVLGSGWPGVLLHEAIGHGLEGDFNRKGSSAFSGRMGQKVASELCTIVDDGTLLGRRGSLAMDDEGSTTQQTVLIENGVLKSYMQDKLNARLMGARSTGNGRRESYAHLPIPRMTNTYMLAGNSDPKDIISSVKRGLYAVNFGGGQVDITSGKFVFSTSEAYLIEDGKVTAPVKGATLIGNGPDILTQVSMVGNDLALDSGVGVCGKDGQNVPVGVGQPTLKVDEMTVGGTK